MLHLLHLYAQNCVPNLKWFWEDQEWERKEGQNLFDYESLHVYSFPF